MTEEITVIRSRRRSFGLEIRCGKAVARVPQYASEAEIQRFLERNRVWLEKHLSAAKQMRQPPLTPAERDELKRQAQELIPRRVEYYAARLGVSYGRITIRSQKTRWGSCSNQGNLNFNCLLMLAPEAVLDSVVVHELCHRLEMNHSSRFYERVLSVLPDYREQAAWLKENGQGLLGRLE